MPDTGAPWNIPYVASSDLVKDWPTDSQDLAEAIADGLDDAQVIAQVVQTVKTDIFTTTSTTFVDVTGLTVTITPSSATNKILLIAQVAITSDISWAYFTRFDGGNAGTYIGDTSGNRIRSIFGGYGIPETQLPSPCAVYLDSPATTSAVTYAFQTRTAGGTVTVNRTSSGTDNTNRSLGASSITAIEVSA